MFCLKLETLLRDRVDWSKQNNTIKVKKIKTHSKRVNQLHYKRIEISSFRRCCHTAEMSLTKSNGAKETSIQRIVTYKYITAIPTSPDGLRRREHWEGVRRSVWTRGVPSVGREAGGRMTMNATANSCH